MVESTPEAIREMEKLYAELGSYKKVAKRLNLNKQLVKAHIEGRNSMNGAKGHVTGDHKVKEASQKKDGTISKQEMSYVEKGKERTSAYRLFSESKDPLNVSIELGISADDSLKYQEEYWRLTGAYHLNHIQRILPDIWSYLELYLEMRDMNLTAERLKRLMEDRDFLIESEKKAVKMREDLTALQGELDKLKTDILDKHKQIEDQVTQLKQKKKEWSNIADDVRKLESKKLTIMKFIQNFENSKSRSEMERLVDEEVSLLLRHKHPKLSEQLASADIMPEEEL
jgi:hypothetical protein